jgi:hypothetical protein
MRLTELSRYLLGRFALPVWRKLGRPLSAFPWLTEVAARFFTADDLETMVSQEPDCVASLLETPVPAIPLFEFALYTPSQLQVGFAASSCFGFWVRVDYAPPFGRVPLGVVGKFEMFIESAGFLVNGKAVHAELKVWHQFVFTTSKAALFAHAVLHVDGAKAKTIRASGSFDSARFGADVLEDRAVFYVARGMWAGDSAPGSGAFGLNSVGPRVVNVYGNFTFVPAVGIRWLLNAHFDPFFDALEGGNDGALRNIEMLPKWLDAETKPRFMTRFLAGVLQEPSVVRLTSFLCRLIRDVHALMAISSGCGRSRGDFFGL